MKIVTSHFAPHANLLRVIEIATKGSHSIALVTGGIIKNDECSVEYLEFLKECYIKEEGETEYAIKIGVFTTDMLTEKVRREYSIFTEIRGQPDFNQLTTKHKHHETVTQVIARAMECENIIENPKLNESSLALLKVAYERLGLQPYELDTIGELAHTIAALDKAGKIEVQHIAEAIQYRGIQRETD